MMKPVKYIYTQFRDMDVFFSHSDTIIGRIIKIGTLMRFAPKDETTPTHGGFLTQSYGQFFASEMKPRFRENSLKDYTGRFEQIVEIWRCSGFDSAEKRNEARTHLEYLHREQRAYDAGGAILSSKLGRMIFPWIKNNKEGDFCTEMSSDVLLKFADPHCPKAPSPLDQSQYFKSNPNMYKKIEEFKVIL